MGKDFPKENCFASQDLCYGLDILDKLEISDLCVFQL